MAKPYWEAQGDLTIGEDLLLYGGRIVVPEALQTETLQKLHQGHQGIQRCRLRTQSSVWWPGISRKIKDFVSQCLECCRDAIPTKEPLLPTQLPDYTTNGRRPVPICLCSMELHTSYSRFPEVIQLTSLMISVINALKATFARYGIPETLVSDNGPQ